MKKIKIWFSGFAKEFDYQDWIIYNILTKRYDVEVTKDADYVFCDCFGEQTDDYMFYEYCEYPQVRIMVLGENYTPDFNLIDYAISLYPITFLDRHFYFPCFSSNSILKLSEIDRNYCDDVLSQKPFFANFISSHESENSIRGDFFKKLCEYKRVESPGRYLNNMDDSTPIAYCDKMAFQRKCKFTLCFESTKHEGFVTEKIVDAFLADTIPVYFGSDTAKDIFNPKAFIHVSDYDSFDDVIARIIEIDNNDDMYLNMLRQPVLNDKDYINNKYDDLQLFLYHIFDQPLEKAYRRSRVYRAKFYEWFLINLRNNYKKVVNNSLIYEKYSGKELLIFLLGTISKRFKLRK